MSLKIASLVNFENNALCFVEIAQTLAIFLISNYEKNLKSAGS